MNADLINIGLAFIEGFALIISPCILPILPIILSGSLAGSKSRPLGIVTGFIITFTVVTLFSREIVQSVHVSQDLIRNFSYGILLLLGVVMMSKTLTEKFNLLTSRLTSVGSSIEIVNNPQGGFWGGVLFGGLVGIIWTPCAGPILAAVIVQVVVQKTTFISILIVTAFAIGAGLPMLLIALIGRGVMTRIAVFREYTSLFRQVLGLIIVLTVLYLIFFPGTGLPSGPEESRDNVRVNSLVNGLEHPYPAPQITGIDAWINSPALNWSDLKGKVVLVDFWTYSCINCIRTLPYLKDWYAKYHDLGFEIVGVHSPEFQFEHDVNNVKNAVAQFGIHYPVALDNRFVSWQNFKNQYWPAHYLVNKEGEVVYVHFGEGEYNVTENNIRYLLGMNEPVQAAREAEVYSTKQTPETYLGYKRADRFASPESVTKDAPANYTYPETLKLSQWALGGEWIISSEKVTSSKANASVKLRFYANKVYMVMGVSKKTPVTLTVLLNGKKMTEDFGPDVVNGQLQVNENKLYFLVDLKKGNEGLLEVIADAPGLEIYTFTFGGI
ncbi:Thiol-disulfide oxidoreductase YkuV [Aquicella siphonis]|uniref:Thiol-disulfide oxidoreductase YkuV n=1 Tax=Aquicella siphonis TaxID=254247 RepID=A0A5E4PL56_9COXI|nr:cytochrome c biogenesis protein CcdA [Aquicella siphonis]VVC77002.1 Thiol-disulfide oxidoreductase YkuV [Aquicella siphonis]